MKPYLSLMTAVFVLSACGGQEAAPPAEQTPPPAASAQATPDAGAAHLPEECRIVVGSDDMMKFDTQELLVKSACKEVGITLKHKGQTPKTAMGHNLVIAKASDKDGVVADGAGAGVDNHYIKAGDERVVASTEMIGGGEESTVVFPVSKLAKGTDYVFFCTFPGHIANMHGTVKLTD